MIIVYEYILKARNEVLASYKDKLCLPANFRGTKY